MVRAMNDDYPLIREDFHPLRAAKYWPEYAQLAKSSQPALNSLDEVNRHFEQYMHLYNDVLMTAPFEIRPPNADILTNHMTLAGHIAALHRSGMNVFSIGPDVRDAIKKTSLKGVRLGDLHLPYETIYVGFDKGSGIYFRNDNHENAWVVDGAYVSLKEATDNNVSFSFRITSRDRLGAFKKEYEDFWPLQHEPFFEFDLSGPPESTFEEALGFAIESGDLPLEPDDDAILRLRTSVVDIQEYANSVGFNVSVPDVTAREREADFNNSNLGSGRNALSLVLGAICVLNARDDESEPTSDWPDDAPRHLIDQFDNPKRSKKALAKIEKELQRAGHMRVRRIYLDAAPNAAKPNFVHQTSGTKRAAHWRSGHFRRQPYGEKLSLVKLIWIMPQMIGGDMVDDKSGTLHRVSIAKPTHQETSSSK